MTGPIFRSKSFVFALLVGLQILLPAAIAVTNLRVIVDLLDARWAEPFLVLSILVGVLCLLLPRPPQEGRSSLADNPQPLAIRIILWWFAILGKRRDGVSLWAETFDEDFTSIFAAQDSISKKAAKALVSELNAEESIQLAKQYTDNEQAYKAYMKGRFFLGKRTTERLQ